MNHYEKLPANWEWKKVSEIANTKSGGTPLRSHLEYFNGGIPWIKSGELGDGYVRNAEEYVTELGINNSSARIFPKGTVLVALYGATAGKVGILDIDAATNQAVCAIFPEKGSFIPKYMFYWVISQRDNLLKQRIGGAQPNISQSIIRSQNFPLAPINIQQSIVSKIEELFSQLDVGVVGLKRAQTALKRYRASVLKAAFEGRLVPQDPNDEPTKKLRQRIGKELSIKDETLKLPHSWLMVKLRSVGEIVTGRTPKKSNPEFYGNDFPFYKPTDLNAGFYTKKASDNLSSLGMTRARLLPEKSVLVTCIGATIGKTGLIRTAGASNQQINAIIPEDFIHPEFLYYVCVSPQFQELIINNASATTLPIINKSKFSELSFPLPPYNEQIRIAVEVDRHLSITEQLEYAIELQIKRSESLRNSILTLAFTGRLI